MRSFARALVVAAFGSCLVVTVTGLRAAAQRRTPVTATRIYTGPDGQTVAETIGVKLSPVAGAFAQWREDSDTTRVANSKFIRFAPGFVQDWHTATQRRYVITLHGNAEIELVGGHKIPLDPEAYS